MSNGNNNGHNRNGTANGVHKDTAPVSSTGQAIVARNCNGAHNDPAIISEHDLLWDGLSPAVINALSQPIDPTLVSQRKGRAGRTFSYIEGHTAIDEANRVFGYGGWGFELVENVTLRRIETADTQTGEMKVVNAYAAPVRVTVPGAPPRTDIGFHAVTDETADGHETALKGAVTDGMKRALRSFGDRFGNGLYGDQAPSTGPSRPQSIPVQSLPRTGYGARANGKPAQSQADNRVQTLRKRLMELAAEQGFDEAKVRAAVQRQTGKDLDGLTADELGPLMEAAANKLRERQQAQAA